jgi:uncharacterized protein (DUF2267 family)
MEVSSADIKNMTDQLVKAVAQRAGLTEAQARSAIVATFEVVKEQLPPNVAKDVDTFMKGGGDVEGALQWFLGLVGRK